MTASQTQLWVSALLFILWQNSIVLLEKVEMTLKVRTQAADLCSSHILIAEEVWAVPALSNRVNSDCCETQTHDTPPETPPGPAVSWWLYPALRITLSWKCYTHHYPILQSSQTQTTDNFPGINKSLENNSPTSSCYTWLGQKSHTDVWQNHSKIVKLQLWDIN